MSPHGSKKNVVRKFDRLQEAEKALLEEVMVPGESLSNGYVSEKTWKDFLKLKIHSEMARARNRRQMEEA